jgi:hypothetical protein
MLDEQGEAIFATRRTCRADPDRRSTMRSIGHVAKLKTIGTMTRPIAAAPGAELMEDNKKTVVNMRKAPISPTSTTVRDDEHSGEFHRPGRAPHLVSVRSQPPGRRNGIGQFCGKSYPRRPGLVPEPA